jgi:hypothetical protein
VQLIDLARFWVTDARTSQPGFRRCPGRRPASDGGWPAPRCGPVTDQPNLASAQGKVGVDQPRRHILLQRHGLADVGQSGDAAVSTPGPHHRRRRLHRRQVAGRGDQAGPVPGASPGRPERTAGTSWRPSARWRGAAPGVSAQRCAGAPSPHPCPRSCRRALRPPRRGWPGLRHDVQAPRAPLHPGNGLGRETVRCCHIPRRQRPLPSNPSRRRSTRIRGRRAAMPRGSAGTTRRRPVPAVAARLGGTTTLRTRLTVRERRWRGRAQTPAVQAPGRPAQTLASRLVLTTRAAPPAACGPGPHEQPQ